MLKPWQFATLMVLAVGVCVLVVTNALLILSNRSEQAAINERQVFLQQTASLEGLYREMVKALADLAVRNGDRRVLDALAAQGISVTVNAPAPSAAETPAKK